MHVPPAEYVHFRSSQRAPSREPPVETIRASVHAVWSDTAHVPCVEGCQVPAGVSATHASSEPALASEQLPPAKNRQSDTVGLHDSADTPATALVSVQPAGQVVEGAASVPGEYPVTQSVAASAAVPGQSVAPSAGCRHSIDCLATQVRGRQVPETWHASVGAGHVTSTHGSPGSGSISHRAPVHPPEQVQNPPTDEVQLPCAPHSRSAHGFSLQPTSRGT